MIPGIHLEVMMDEREWLTERFQQHRSHLRAVADRMPGSVTEADDALQEAWLRIRGQGVDGAFCGIRVVDAIGRRFAD